MMLLVTLFYFGFNIGLTVSDWITYRKGAKHHRLSGIDITLELLFGLPFVIIFLLTNKD